MARDLALWLTAAPAGIPLSETGYSGNVRQGGAPG